MGTTGDGPNFISCIGKSFYFCTALGVGDVQGDQARRSRGQLASGGASRGGFLLDGNAIATGVFAGSVSATALPVYLTGQSSALARPIDYDSANTGPVGAANAPRRWGALACADLGAPTS